MPLYRPTKWERYAAEVKARTGEKDFPWPAAVLFVFILALTAALYLK